MNERSVVASIPLHSYFLIYPFTCSHYSGNSKNFFLSFLKENLLLFHNNLQFCKELLMKAQLLPVHTALACLDATPSIEM